MNREEINRKINENNEKIDVLFRENDELFKQSLLLSDETQWFKEEIEHHPRKKWERKPGDLDGKLVGRIYWNAEFKDEDNPDNNTIIERNRIVRVDGNWVI